MSEVAGILAERGAMYGSRYGRYKQLESDDVIWAAVESTLPVDLKPGQRSALRLATHKFVRALVIALDGRTDMRDSLDGLEGYLRLSVGIDQGKLPEDLN